MAVYKEIIEWSVNKPTFMRDAIRRLLNNHQLTETDVDESLLLLKKEVGFTGVELMAIPATIEDIPEQSHISNLFSKLVSINNPKNINALYDEAKLEFSIKGLSIIFGNNGSGKSSYGRILKKLCWSRHKNIEIKSNVYKNDKAPQEVNIKFSIDGVESEFEWKAGQKSIEPLNSVYIFDSACASIYLNNENPIEYKPAGIDLLESLIKLCGRIDERLNTELSKLTIQRPVINQKYSNSKLSAWYRKIEDVNVADIETRLVYSEENAKRKIELIDVLGKENPSAEIQSFQQKVIRYKTITAELSKLEKFLSNENLSRVIRIKEDYNSKRDSYLIAKESNKGVDPVAGVGSESWKLLWETAKKFAITEVHPLVSIYPADESLKSCVLCQQPLVPEAKDRLLRFNKFVSDETSQQFSRSQSQLDEFINEISGIDVSTSNTYEELNSDIPSFAEHKTGFQELVQKVKGNYLAYLKSSEIAETPTPFTFYKLSESVSVKTLELEGRSATNKQLIVDRKSLEAELLELETLEFLTLEKDTIIKYVKEHSRKHWLNRCKLKTNTRLISLKIGEIMESKAIEQQHEEFMRHLISLNPSIAHKISIKRTRTVSGATYLKCGFNTIDDSLQSVLSDGEQKVVALANFLSECTVDGAKNSMVFDDPVTSLDQDYRESIAKKIVELSHDRQVIVLTHDLYFVRLLMDIHKSMFIKDCEILGLMEYKGISGIPSDEIHYLSKNVQQRVDSIRSELGQISSLHLSELGTKESRLESVRQKMRKLVERAVEEVLVSNTIQRFSKNINLKKGFLSNLVVVEKNDIEFISTLFGKYSITEHDGGIETIPLQPDENEISNDLHAFSTWKDGFQSRAKSFKQANGY